MQTDSRSTRTMSAGIMMAVALLFFHGCAQDQRDANGVSRDTAGRPSLQVDSLETPEPRAQSKEGTIIIEGMAMPIRLELFDSSPYSLPLPFTTYIPSDIIAEQVPDSAGPGIMFVANFNGERNADASMLIFVLPTATTADDARAAAQRVATGTGRKKRAGEEKIYSWSVAEYLYAASTQTGEATIGRIIVGEHGGRFFYIQTEYPPEFSEGFDPRMALIFDEWLWSDETMTGIAAGSAQDGAAGSVPTTAAKDTASIIATIARIEPPTAGGNMLGTLVLEDRNISDTMSNRTIVRVANTTRLFIERNGKRSAAKFTDLKAGVLVRVIFSGPVPMIYPMRVTADEIVVVSGGG